MGDTGRRVVCAEVTLINMARAKFVKAAQKDYPEYGIKKVAMEDHIQELLNEIEGFEWSIE